MKTSLDILEGLKRSLTVELPIETFKQKTDKVLQKMAPTVAINGFRKGKVPLSVLRQQFGENANSDAVNEMVNETLVDALSQVKLTPVARPTITKVDTNNEHHFSYTVEFEIYPEIKLADFSKLTIEQIDVKITKSDEDKTLKGLIEQSTEYKAVKRKSKIDDQINVDFKGMIDGEEFEGGKATDFKLVLGKGAMIAGFEKGLVDVSADTTINLDLKFPKEYHVPKLAGQAVNFEVTVKEVAAPKTPKLDEDFAKKFGEKDMNALKQSMKMQMRVEVDNRLFNQNKDAVFNALLEANEFVVPQASIDNEAQNLLQEMQDRMQQQGMPASNGSLAVSTFNPEAQRRVKLGLLIAKIADDNELSASKTQVSEKLKEMAEAHGENAQQMIDHYNEDSARLSSIELLVVEQMVQNAILEKATVAIKHKKFSEVTQQIQA